MRFLLDACISSRRMRAVLANLGHDVTSALDMAPGTLDEEILAIAVEERRILVTEDKDFGELVHVQGLPHPCIVRFVDMRLTEKTRAIVELIDLYSDALTSGAFVVVTRDGVRIRPAGEVDQG